MTKREHALGDAVVPWVLCSESPHEPCSARLGADGSRTADEMPISNRWQYEPKHDDVRCNAGRGGATVLQEREPRALQPAFTWIRLVSGSGALGRAIVSTPFFRSALIFSTSTSPDSVKLRSQSPRSYSR